MILVRRIPPFGARSMTVCLVDTEQHTCPGVRLGSHSRAPGPIESCFLSYVEEAHFPHQCSSWCCERHQYGNRVSCLVESERVLYDGIIGAKGLSTCNSGICSCVQWLCMCVSKCVVTHSMSCVLVDFFLSTNTTQHLHIHKLWMFFFLPVSNNVKLWTKFEYVQIWMWTCAINVQCM